MGKSTSPATKNVGEVLKRPLFFIDSTIVKPAAAVSATATNRQPSNAGGDQAAAASAVADSTSVMMRRCERSAIAVPGTPHSHLRIKLNVVEMPTSREGNADVEDGAMYETGRRCDKLAAKAAS